MAVICFFDIKKERCTCRNSPPFSIHHSEQYFSTALDKQIETLGDKHADMQVTRFSANTQPYYFFLDNNENKLVGEGYGYDPGIQKFIHLLDSVKKEYKNRKC